MSDLLDPPPEKLTANHIRAAMLARFGAAATNGRSSVLFEVGNSTGHARSRSADGLIMWCWPSDGLELHGVEIKVARSDWLHELRQPKKADDIAKYCDRWWLFTAPGVVKDVDELPPAWGWRVFDGKSWRTMKDAAKTDAVAIDRGFLGAVLRNAGRASDAMLDRAREEARDAIEDEVERRVAQRLKARTPDKMAALLETVTAFEAATGIELHKVESYGWLTTEDGRRIGRMVAAMKASGVDGSSWKPGSLKNLQAHLQESLAAIRQVSAECGLDEAKPKGRRR